MIDVKKLNSFFETFPGKRMSTWRRKVALLLNFLAIVIIAVAVLVGNDAYSASKALNSLEKEVDELLSSAHIVRVCTGIALALATIGFVLEGYDHYHNLA